jgi:hypothetical protein
MADLIDETLIKDLTATINGLKEMLKYADGPARDQDQRLIRHYQSIIDAAQRRIDKENEAKKINLKEPLEFRANNGRAKIAITYLSSNSDLTHKVATDLPVYDVNYLEFYVDSTGKPKSDLIGGLVKNVGYWA